jgi:hypothetical protein
MKKDIGMYGPMHMKNTVKIPEIGNQTPQKDASKPL